MKELFNKLSNISQSFKEDRLVYQGKKGFDVAKKVAKKAPRKRPRKAPPSAAAGVTKSKREVRKALRWFKKAQRELRRKPLTTKQKRKVEAGERDAKKFLAN